MGNTCDCSNAVVCKKRAAFYVFFSYNKTGDVLDYVPYYLNALKEVAETICVIVNGALSDNGRERLSATGAEILVRENRGFDFAAWKEALVKFGNERLSKFDEIILCNCSCYGPIDSFVPTFEKMDKVACDFWGLCEHQEGNFPIHIQAYFLVLKRSLFLSKVFAEYWNQLKEAKTYWEAVGQETLFAKYFTDRGFSAASLASTSAYDKTVLEPLRLIVKNAFPLIKRKIFTELYQHFHAVSRGDQARDVLAFLDKKNKKLAAAVRQDLLKTLPESWIRERLHNMFVLPDSGTPKPVHNPERVALIIYSYFEDLVDEDLSRALCMPEGSSVFIVVVSEKMKSMWEARREALGNRHVEIRIQENRGRNEAAYWITCRDVIESYELICVAHDKKSVHLGSEIKAKAFSDHCWENILKSSRYVENVIAFFDENPSFGILMPPPPIFGSMSFLIGVNWWEEDITEKIAFDVYNKLKMTVPFDKAPNAPWGTMFWLRGKAMSAFYRYPWSINDLPEEPLQPNTTLLHVFELMYSMFIQEAGYFSAWILPSSDVGVYYDNILFQALREKAFAFPVAENEPKAPFSISHIHFAIVKRFAKLYLKKKWIKLFGKNKKSR